MKRLAKEYGLISYLKPVGVDDASDIVNLRLSLPERNRFLHPISSDIDVQKTWIERYLERPGDWYFMVMNRFTGEVEGTIGLYDFDLSRNEAIWGRWIVLPQALSAIESVILLMRFAFATLGLHRIYSLTLANNEKTISFHDSLGETQEKLVLDAYEFGGHSHDAIMHSVRREQFESICDKANPLIFRLHKMLSKQHLGTFSFDRQGILLSSPDRAIMQYRSLGYVLENSGKHKVQLLKGNHHIEFWTNEAVWCAAIGENHEKQQASVAYQVYFVEALEIMERYCLLGGAQILCRGQEDGKRYTFMRADSSYLKMVEVS